MIISNSGSGGSDGSGGGSSNIRTCNVCLCMHAYRHTAHMSGGELLRVGSILILVLGYQVMIMCSASTYTILPEQNRSLMQGIIT